MDYKEMKNRIACTDNNIFVVIPNVLREPFVDVAKIMADIKDVRVINNVVIVDFTDGTSEKAVLSPEDSFNFEQGISICLTKKLLSNLTRGNGSSVYNKLIKHTMKVYEKNRENEIKLKELEEAAKRKAEKERERQRMKAERRFKREQNANIAVLKEAIKGALIDLMNEKESRA